jgi:hypothetical protein
VALTAERALYAVHFDSFTLIVIMQTIRECSVGGNWPFVAIRI